MRWVAIALVLVLAGCGSSNDEDAFTLVRVGGFVRQDGKPLEGATVSFMPDRGNKESTPANAATNPAGGYDLVFKGRYGVAAGKYKVMITPPVVLPPGVVIPDAFKDDPVMFQTALAARKQARPKRAVKGKKEKDPAKIGFDAVVEPNGGMVMLDFDVPAPAPDTTTAGK